MGKGTLLELGTFHKNGDVLKLFNDKNCKIDGNASMAGN
jgi:hypothetical protein